LGLNQYKEFLHRASTASLQELLLRFLRLLDDRYLKFRRGTKRQFLPAGFDKQPVPDLHGLKLPDFDADFNAELISNVKVGMRFTLSEDEKKIKDFEKLHQSIFFKRISKGSPQHDIRMIWESGRLQHLTILLLWTQAQENPAIAREIHEQVKRSLLSWIQRNAFLFGPHFMSAMECGLRIPVFIYCLKLIDSFSAAEQKSIVACIFQHAWWVERRLSLFSSLGNHTICESVGLLFAGTVYKDSKIGQRWIKKGCDLLRRELTRQILMDGGPAEQSLSYHRFVLDLYWLAINFAERNGLRGLSMLKQRLEAGEEFLKAFSCDEGIFPSIGDSDDGHAIAQGIKSKRVLGPVEKGAVQRMKAQRLCVKTFNESGYTILKGANGLRFTFDHGCLGMPPLFNHGHADALSITHSYRGKDFLVDPGTFRYNGMPEWRRYFKSTRAHNTVSIDNYDQAEQVTGFIWAKPYNTDLIINSEINGDTCLKATHDGYMRLRQPVRHSRVVINIDEVYFVVKDQFCGDGVHAFELNMHFHPEVVLCKENAGWKANHHGVEVFFIFLHNYTVDLIKGMKNPIFGWHSPAYGIKKESSVLSCAVEGFSNDISFLTMICLDDIPELKSLQERLIRIEQQIENSQSLGRSAE
jgi:hypothetical protein